MTRTNSICQLPYAPAEVNKVTSEPASRALGVFSIFLNHLAESWLWLSLKGRVSVFHLSRPYVYKRRPLYKQPLSRHIIPDLSSRLLIYFSMILFFIKGVQCLLKPHVSFSVPSNPRLVYISPSADLCAAVCQSLLLFFIKASALFPGGINCQTSQTLMMHIT